MTCEDISQLDLYMKKREEVLFGPLENGEYLVNVSTRCSSHPQGEKNSFYLFSLCRVLSVHLNKQGVSIPVGITSHSLSHVL